MNSLGQKKTIGNFTLQKKISFGGMAEVYRATTNEPSGISKVVAIKTILPEHANKPNFEKMFENEARVTINLTHSCIAQIFQFGNDRGTPYLVMEYVEGFDLRSIFVACCEKKTPLPVEQALYIASQIANGLNYAHSCVDKLTQKPLAIVHRDINHTNILINQNGEIKIIDFGIAKTSVQSENTRVGTIKGKFAYMSPEQARGENLDGRSDVFSLGIVLWELLCARKLFISGSDYGILSKVVECKIESPKKYNPHVDDTLERFVMKALHGDREKRYQTAQELYLDLRGYLNQVSPGFVPTRMYKDFEALLHTEHAAVPQSVTRIDVKEIEKSEDEIVLGDVGLMTLTSIPEMPKPSNQPGPNPDKDASKNQEADSLELNIDDIKRLTSNSSGNAEPASARASEPAANKESSAEPPLLTNLSFDRISSPPPASPAPAASATGQPPASAKASPAIKIYGDSLKDSQQTEEEKQLEIAHDRRERYVRLMKYTALSSLLAFGAYVAYQQRDTIEEQVVPQISKLTNSVIAETKPTAPADETKSPSLISKAKGLFKSPEQDRGVASTPTTQTINEMVLSGNFKYDPNMNYFIRYKGVFRDLEMDELKDSAIMQKLSGIGVISATPKR